MHTEAQAARCDGDRDANAAADVGTGAEAGSRLPEADVPAANAPARWGRSAFVLAAVALATVVLRSSSVLFDKPFTEDGYYLLSASRHLALGDGLSVDGVQQTNGVQPLFTFLAALAYLPVGGDRVAGLRLVALLHAATFVFSAWLFGLVLRDAFAAAADRTRELLRWLGSLAYLASGYLFLVHHNGLETGTVLACYLACWRLHQVRPLDSLARGALHGAAFGALVLARIDATFVVAAFCALHVLRPGRPRAERLAQAAVAGAVAVAVSSPWWLYNLFAFGSLMPTSGQAQMLAGSVTLMPDDLSFRVAECLRAWLLVATPELYLGNDAGPPAVQAVRVLLLAGSLVLAAPALRRAWRARAVGAGGAGGAAGAASAAAARTAPTFAAAVLLGFVALAVWYTLRFWAAHFYPRYFAPLAPFGLALFVLAVHRVAGRVRPIAALAPAGFAAAALGIAVVAHTGVGFAGSTFCRHQRALVQERVPAGAVVAAGQSGTLGYFFDHVLNLDGKVSAAALAHQHAIGDYLAANGAEWLCDWRSYLGHYLGPALQRDWELVDRRGEFELWRRLVTPSAR